MASILKRCALLLALVTLAFAGKKQIDWLTAKVLDSNSAKTYTPVVSASSSSDGNGNSESAVRIHSIAVRDTQLMLVTPEFAYVVEDTRNTRTSGASW